MRPSNDRKAHGFTLIELMVAIAVLAVLLAIGIPSFRDYIADQRARAAAEELMLGLTLARSEAIKRNATVTVSAADSDWAQGWAVSVGGKSYSDCAAGAAGCIRVSQTNGDVQITGAGLTSVSFERSGRTAGAATPTFSVCDSENISKQRQVSLDLSGRAVISRAGGCS